MSFICMRMKNHLHIKGWALNLVLKQRPGVPGNGLLTHPYCPVHTYGYLWIWIILETDFLFSLLAFHLHLNGVFGQRKYRFPNTAPRVEVFENANFSFTCADGLKRGFLNSLWSYIHTTSMPILCKGCHRRAFSYGRAKTIQILSTARVDTFVWKRNVKFFVF